MRFRKNNSGSTFHGLVHALTNWTPSEFPMIGALVRMMCNIALVSAAFVADLHMRSWQFLPRNDKRKLTSRRDTMRGGGGEERKTKTKKQNYLTFSTLTTCCSVCSCVDRAIRKGSQRGMEWWVRSVFEKTSCWCFVGSSCMEVCFGSWVKFLGLVLFHFSYFERSLGSKIMRCAHGTHCPNSRIGLCKASFAHAF